MWNVFVRFCRITKLQSVFQHFLSFFVQDEDCILTRSLKLEHNVSVSDFVEQVVALDAQNIVAVSCGEAHIH